jgi:D-glycero-D-manno-heptose 1,7-bisphosphate phosphatase
LKAMSVRLIVLDRDGVINHDSDAFIRTPAEWRPLDGSLQAIALLTRHGFTVTVASNQSGIGRGLLDRNTLYAVHRKMRRAAERVGGSVDRIVYCPHLPGDGCDCRKPATGLLERLAGYYGVPLRGVPVIGDALRDLQAASAVGARPILVLTGKGQSTRHALEGEGKAVETYEDLLAAARQLVAEQPARIR